MNKTIHFSTISALLFCSVLLGSIAAKADDDHTVTYQPCSSDQQAGDTCLMMPDSELLHPTQANVGVIEVQCKYHKFSGKSGKDMGDYLNDYDHHVPAIIGPDGIFYITDHHHMSAALLLTQQQGQHTTWALRMDVLQTFYNQTPPYSMEEFEQYMVENNFAYLYNNGQQITWDQLPASLADMTDDPYRTQAGLQKDDNLNGFIKPANNPMFFLEFKWGNLMRSNQILGADIPVCKLSADKDNLWYEDSKTCSQQADLQKAKLQTAYNLITSSCAATAMIPQCMYSMEGVSELCGYNANAAYPFSQDVKITKSCNLKDD